MLSKDLYILCNNLTLNNTNENLNFNELNFLDINLFDYLNSKNLFIQKWCKLLNYNFSNTRFNYYYNILEESSSYLKLLLRIQSSFILNNLNINTSSVDNYILIISKNSKLNKILYLVCEEESPSLFSKLKHNNIDNILYLNNINSTLKKLWDTNYLVASNLYSKFMNTSTLINRSQTKFNIKKACDYAEKYALILNPEYKDFTDIGGDCTNYVSQILYAGGLNTSKIWYPYSNAWVRVQELYDYLTNYNIAKVLPNNVGLDKGCLIQFLIPTTNRFSHTAFITHKLPHGDFLYCCHSYNKLNYPLGLIYPVTYKTMRSLTIN